MGLSTYYSSHKYAACCISDSTHEMQPSHAASYVYRLATQAGDTSTWPCTPPTHRTRCYLRMQRHRSVDLLLELEMPGLVHLRKQYKRYSHRMQRHRSIDLLPKLEMHSLLHLRLNMRDAATVCSGKGLWIRCYLWRDLMHLRQRTTDAATACRAMGL